MTDSDPAAAGPLDDQGSRQSALGKRFEYDARPTLRLNALQRDMKLRLEAKVRSGAYQFERVPCTLCGEDEWDPLASKDRYGLFYPVVVCRRCGLVQTSPRMTEPSYTAFYGDEYRALYDGEDGPSEDFFGAQYVSGKRIFRYVARCGGLRAEGRAPAVLEVGCGAGGILQYFKDQGCRVLGVDLGEEYLAFGRDHHGLDLRQGTLAELDSAQRFDLIIYSHVVEHLLDPVAELTRARALLAEGGAIYIEVPGLRSLWRFYRMDLLRYLQNAHTFHFTAFTLRWTLGRAGFVPVHCDEWVHSLFVPAASPAELPGRAEVGREIARTLGYLRRAELLRRVAPLHPADLREPLIHATLWTLRATRLFGVVRAVRRAILGALGRS